MLQSPSQLPIRLKFTASRHLSEANLLEHSRRRAGQTHPDLRDRIDNLENFSPNTVVSNTVKKVRYNHALIKGVNKKKWARHAPSELVLMIINREFIDRSSRRTLMRVQNKI
jgi:hypothetical protein